MRYISYSYRKVSLVGGKLERKTLAVENSAVRMLMDLSHHYLNGLPWGLKTSVSMHNCLCAQHKAQHRRAATETWESYIVSPSH